MSPHLLPVVWGCDVPGSGRLASWGAQKRILTNAPTGVFGDDEEWIRVSTFLGAQRKIDLGC